MKIKRMVVSSFQTNCYVAYDQNKAIIVDPGDQAKKIKNFILENELEVQAILLTHGHCDHIGAIDVLYQAFSCPIYLHEEDHVYLKNPNLNLSTMLSTPLVIQAPVLKAPESLQVGDFQLKWHHLPGHTPGSSIIEWVDQHILFSGDVLFEGSIGRFDFPMSSKHDTMMTIQKIKEIEGDYKILPGHGNVTTLGYEKANNPYLNM